MGLALLSQTIGTTGYIYCINSRGIIQVHPKPALLGANLGKISLHSLTGENPMVFYLLVVVIGLVFIAAAFGVHKLEKSTSKSWL